MEVEREIVVPEAPDEVWEALTEPAQLEEWFATEVELDARPGGEGVFRWGDGDERRAVVRELEQGERLVLDWDDGGRVAIELEPSEDGTRVRVVETSPEFAPALELRACALLFTIYARPEITDGAAMRDGAPSSRRWPCVARPPRRSSLRSCRSPARRSRNSSRHWPTRACSARPEPGARRATR